jgi:prolyl oligopeptidase
MSGVTLPGPPATAKKPVSETLHGETFVDNYRWLESGKSPETRAWIAAQSGYTDKYLSQIAKRPEIVAQLTKLQRVDTTGMPTERGGRFYYMKRLADENQASIYVRDSLGGPEKRLVDATKLSADQNSSVTIADVSRDGKLLVYGVRVGGADEMKIHVLKTANGEEMPVDLPVARYQGISLAEPANSESSADITGIYYSVYRPESGSFVYQYNFGNGNEPKQIFGGEFNGEKFSTLDLIGMQVTEDGRFMVLEAHHGVPATRVDVYVSDLNSADRKFVPLIHGIDSRFSMEYAGEGNFYVHTDYKAPNGRVLKADLKNPNVDAWQTVVPEGKDVISSLAIAGHRLFVSRLADVKTQTTIYSFDGKRVGQVEYPGIGEGSNVSGRIGSNTGFFSFQSFVMPPTIYSFNIGVSKAEVWAANKTPFDSSKYEVTQVFYTSKDGTKIPMFIAGKKGLPRDGSVPTLMTGYGGFNLPMTSSWNPEYAWWMEQGGYFAMPNLRGGAEYGENWHKQAMFEKKQNVFDDWFAAAEYLIANKYTTTPRLAIRGRSNGGLLMGASMTQRPDLYGAIWCGYPLLDMLRYQNFLIGRTWTTEYGSADDPAQFVYIRKYSPYQNVKPGTKYPAIMFFTGDSDTRVDPLHARKMAALMQVSNGDDRPILLHYSVKSGHSAGVSITQLVEDEADELAFLWNETGGK